MLWGPVSLPTLVVLPLWLFPFIKKELYCFMVVYCLWLKVNCTDHCDVSFWQWYFWFQVITVCCFFRKQWTCSVKHGMLRVRHSVDDLLTPLQSALTPVELSTWNDPLSSVCVCFVFCFCFLFFKDTFYCYFSSCLRFIIYNCVFEDLSEWCFLFCLFDFFLGRLRGVVVRMRLKWAKWEELNFSQVTEA